MEITGMWGAFYRISNWVTRFAWLNLLWLAFTFLGLILFGIMPATIAMFAVTRKWVQKDYDVPVFKTFFKHYKENFIKGNLFGLVIYILGYFLSVFLKYTGLMSESSVYPILFGIFVIAAFLYTMLVLYIAPVFVHYQLSFWQYIRYAVTIGAINVHYSICTLAFLGIIYYISLKIPGVTLFFSFSVSAYVAMFIINLGFRFLIKKRDKELEMEKESLPTS